MMSVVMAASGRRAHVLQDRQVAVAAVGAAHRPQDRVRAGLQRHVQAGHHVRGLRHRGDHVVGEVARVRRGEADPLKPVDLAAGAQQLAEGQPVAELGPVGVHVLPEQGDLDDPLVDQGPDLVQDVARTAVLLLAPQRRDDAEGAGVVAADRDRHPGRVGRLAAGGQQGRERAERLLELDLGLLALAGLLEQPGQGADVVRAVDHVHPGRAVDDLLALHLGQTAADRDLHARVRLLGRKQVTQVPVQPVGRVLAHGAGVEHHQVRVLALVRLAVAGLFEQPGHPLRVVHVHLAPVGADLVRPSFAHLTRIGADARSDVRS
jgi:hypothetical protein